MKTDTTLTTRRRLLAQAPVVAVAAVPTVAIAFPDVPDIAALMQGRPDWQIRGIISMVDMLPQDHDETRKVLTAICESIKVSMRARDADAELLALKPGSMRFSTNGAGGLRPPIWTIKRPLPRLSGARG